MSLISLFLTEYITMCLACILFALCSYYFYFKCKSSACYNFPPGPTPLPLIGNIHLMDLRRPYKTFMQLGEVYGPVFTFYMGPKKTVVLAGYDAVKDALVNHVDGFGERGRIPLFEKLQKGHGIIFGHGESWKQMRRFALTVLRDFGMGKKTIENRITEECRMLMDVFQSFKGEPTDPSKDTTAAMSNIICSIVFGERFDYEDPTFVSLLKLMQDMTKLVGSPKIHLLNSFPLLKFIPGALQKVYDASAQWRNFSSILYQKHKSNIDHNDIRSFVDAFIVKQEQESTQNGEKYFHYDNFLRSVLNLFTAGTETTATTLCWGFLVLMKYPEIQKKVHKEIDTVIGSERSPNAEDRKNMPYTNAVLHEIQRFGNVVPMNIQHETAEDVHFRGYFLPQGTQVIPFLTSVLYDKAQWKTPYEFNPSHFLDVDGNFIKKDAFLPFSVGRRSCIGENLAKMELFLFFTTLLQKFEICPPPGVTLEEIDLTPSGGIMCSPHPFKMCVLSR